MSGKPGTPEKQTILQARDHLLAMNPDLRVVGAHLGSMENDLDDLSTRLDRYPNFAVDTAARVRTLAIQPRDKVRAFILKYQDRILYGTDLHFVSGTTGRRHPKFGNDNTPSIGVTLPRTTPSNISGKKSKDLIYLALVLKKLYHDNAIHWIPGIDATPR